MKRELLTIDCALWQTPSAV